MTGALAVVGKAPASIFELGVQLSAVLNEAAPESTGGELSDAARERVADLVEALRNRVVRKPDRDLGSLFDLDDRLIELMDTVEEHQEQGIQIPQEVAMEIDAYLEAYRQKVDRIVGFLRWQETIAGICGKEAERLSARKKAADNRVNRLKGFLLAFMTARGIRKLEGERSSIGMQANGQASLAIDDPLRIAESYYEKSFRFGKLEIEELVNQISEGPMRRRLQAALKAEDWQLNESAIRAALVANEAIAGARLVKGNHLRIR